jgi:hypothetical protein
MVANRGARNGVRLRFGAVPDFLASGDAVRSAAVGAGSRLNLFEARIEIGEE